MQRPIVSPSRRFQLLTQCQRNPQTEGAWWLATFSGHVVIVARNDDFASTPKRFELPENEGRMPNRILKDSICTSDNIDALTAEEEVFWYRLIVQCDDYGRMDARPAILRARCYPLRLNTVKEQDIATWLTSLQRADLVHLYTIDDKPYLQIATWDRHQQVRAKRSKYPQMISDDISCKQTQALAPVIQSNPIQYNTPAGSSADDIETAPACDPAFAQACEAYHQNIGMLTKIISDKLAEDVAEYGAPWVIDAIGIAVTAEKRDLRYVEGILRRWKQNGRRNGNGAYQEQAAEVF